MHTVLVVEDDAGILRMLAQQLTAEGFSVLAIADRDDALLLVEHVQALEVAPRVVMLELLLPSGSGLDILVRLRAQGKTLPVIAYSGYPALFATAVTAGATLAIAKPFEIGALVTLITRLCPQPHE